jgi:hypothetical protein
MPPRQRTLPALRPLDPRKRGGRGVLGGASMRAPRDVTIPSEVGPLRIRSVSPGCATSDSRQDSSSGSPRRSAHHGRRLLQVHERRSHSFETDRIPRKDKKKSSHSREGVFAQLIASVPARRRQSAHSDHHPERTTRTSSRWPTVFNFETTAWAPHHGGPYATTRLTARRRCSMPHGRPPPSSRSRDGTTGRTRPHAHLPLALHGRNRPLPCDGLEHISVSASPFFRVRDDFDEGGTDTTRIAPGASNRRRRSRRWRQPTSMRVSPSHR